MVADRYERILAVLAKLETIEGTDATPTGAANTMVMSNVSITPMAGDETSHDHIQTYMGHKGVVLVGDYVQIEGDVDLAGSGTEGVAPGFGPLLRACGFEEIITADTSVAYEPISSGFESCSIYWIEDGVRHVALGARGTMTLSLVPKQIPRLRFTMMGLLGTITDQANPTTDFSAFVDGLPVNKANTTLSLHGYAAVAESLEINLGQTVSPRFLIGEEGMKITNREATGTAVVKADTVANKNWFAVAQARTLDALQAVHGTQAGNIATIDAPAVQIGRPTRGATDGILNYSLPLMLKPDAGNDELTLTFT